MVFKQKTFIILIFSFIMEINSQTDHYYFENQNNIKFNAENKQILTFYFRITNKYISNEYDNIALILDLDRPFYSYIRYSGSQETDEMEITPCEDGDNKYIFKINSKNKEYYILRITFTDKYNNRGILERYPQDFKCSDKNDYLTNYSFWLMIGMIIVVIALYYNWIICCCKCCGNCKDTRYCCCLCVECNFCKSSSSTIVKVYPYKTSSDNNSNNSNFRKEMENFRENQRKEFAEIQKEIEENEKIQRQREKEEIERQIERVREEYEFRMRRDLDLQERVNKGLA